MTTASPAPRPEPAAIAPRLSPTVLGLWGLCVLWAAVASMDWWGVASEERWLSALTLQSLSMGDGWSVDRFATRYVVSSPLGPLLGRLFISLMPSAPLVLWALSVAGAGLFGLGCVLAWGGSSVALVGVGLWCGLIWMTHPLVLSSFGSGWPFALGLMAVGAGLLEARRERAGWVLVGLAILGRAEMLFGLVGLVVWRAWKSGVGDVRRRPWWALALIPPVLWGLGTLAIFGRLWPETWPAALETSRGGHLPDDLHHWPFLRSMILPGHRPWLATLGVLAVVGVATLRTAPAIAWAGLATGVGCLLVHGGLGLAGGHWWWLYLGPLAGLMLAAAAGFGFLVAPSRSRPIRAVGILLGLATLVAQWQSPWELPRWSLLRDEGERWEEMGSWLRENTDQVRSIATTHPGALLWHLGIGQRLSVHTVTALAGPLAARDLAPLDRLRAAEPDLLALCPAGDEPENSIIWSYVESSDKWMEIHRVEAPDGRDLVVHLRTAQDAEDFGN